MAFTVTVVGTSVFGDMRVVYGTYVNDSGSTGGAITTGLGSCKLWNATNSTDENAVEISHSAGTLTIDCTADNSGDWFAIGN